MSAKQDGFLSSSAWFGRTVAACFLATALLLPATDAAAAARLEHRGSAEDQRACTPDVFRLCMSAIPNEPRIVACLIRSKRVLSPACRMVFERGAEKRPRQAAAQTRPTKGKTLGKGPSRPKAARSQRVRRADNR